MEFAVDSRDDSSVEGSGEDSGVGFWVGFWKDSSVEDPGEDSRVDYGIDSGRICLCRLLGRILEQIVGSESKVLIFHYFYNDVWDPVTARWRWRPSFVWSLKGL